MSMKLEQIDKNFNLPKSLDVNDIVWRDASGEPFKLYGAYSANPYLRMPMDVAERVSDSVAVLNRHTAGVRVRFRCDSPYIGIRAVSDPKNRSGYKASNSSGFSLYSILENGEFEHSRSFDPPSPFGDDISGFERITETHGRMLDYVIDFPSYNVVDELYIGVKEGTRFETPKGYKNELPVVFYGSSITQGGCADTAGNTYQDFLSRWHGMHYLNFGFAGSARGEDAIIEYLASLDMSVFVSDYDHNAPTVEHLKATHYKLYEAVRRAHPDIPYIMISKPYFTSFDRAENLRRKRVIKDSYKKALANGDKNVYFIDGESFFGKRDRATHKGDNVHPNDLGFYKMAKRLEKVLVGLF